MDSNEYYSNDHNGSLLKDTLRSFICNYTRFSEKSQSYVLPNTT